MTFQIISNRKKLFIVILLGLFIYCSLQLRGFIKEFKARNYHCIQEVKSIVKQSYSPLDNINDSKIISGEMELSPFVWRNRLYHLVTYRDKGDKEFNGLRILDAQTGKVLFQFAEGHGLASVLTLGEKILVVATKNWVKKGQSELKLFILDGLNGSVEERSVMRANSRERLFNTSMTYNDETHEYIIAYETDDQGVEYKIKPFSTKFLTSKNLMEWKKKGAIFSAHHYAACPTIRFKNGYYYLWYLGTNGDRYLTFQTHVARSKNLVNWEFSSYPYISPAEGDGVNASDFDYIVHDGKSYIYYANGDQKTWTQIKHFVVDGDISENLDDYFSDKFMHMLFPKTLLINFLKMFSKKNYLCPRALPYQVN